MTDRQRQRKGTLIAVAGVLATTPDAVLLRWAQATHAKLAAILCWKLLLISIVMFAFARYYEKGKTFAALWKNPVLVICIGATMALRSSLLSYAYVFTYAATAVMLFSLHPLWSGVLGWIFLGDVLPRRTVVALVLAIVALIFMFYPELASGSFGSGRMTIGDGLALATSVLMSIYLCLARHASRVDPEISVPTASSFGLLVGTGAVVVISSLTGSTVVDGITGPGMAAIILDGFAVSSVNLAHAIAPKYATATQIGLISLIEAVLSPVWVYAVYREVPDVYTLAGGACIIIILAGHELLSDCDAKKEQPLKDDDLTQNDLDAALLKDEDKEKLEEVHVVKVEENTD